MRPLHRLCAVAFVALFIAAPTPGDVGGCGGGAGNQRVMEGNLNANPPETREYMYFDRGLCAHYCWRLYECNLLCDALTNPPENCRNNQTAQQTAFFQCARGLDGTLSTAFGGLSSCPHACPGGTHFVNAYEQDVLSCGHAVMELACSPASIGVAFQRAPSECAHPAVCARD